MRAGTSHTRRPPTHDSRGRAPPARSVRDQIHSPTEQSPEQSDRQTDRHHSTAQQHLCESYQGHGRDGLSDFKCILCWKTQRARSAVRRGENCWTTVEQLNLATRIYKILNEQVAVPPVKLDIIVNDRPVRGTVTQQRLHIGLPRCRTTEFQKSFTPRTIPEWNSLPNAITSAASVSSFRSQLTTSVMSLHP